MGLGDWILATAEARHFHNIHELPVVFAKRETRQVFWSEVFENNPKIVREPQPGQNVVVVENYDGRRPYIKLVTRERYHYNNNFCIEPGEIFLSDKEKALGIEVEGAVIVEPHTKTGMGLSRNKAWPWERWQELVSSIDRPWLQLGTGRVLEGVRHVRTERFRDALPYIAKASLIVTTDGATHHAAAALDKKAVVLWGGVASPDLLGYRTHINICHEENPCGSFNDCLHCREAMGRIEVEEVRDAIQRLSVGSAQAGRSVKSSGERIAG